MDRNPFEPPRTDVDGPAVPLEVAGDLPAQAIADLAGCAKWADAAALMSWVGVALSLASTVVSFVKLPGQTASAVGGFVFGVPIAILFALLFRAIGKASKAVGRGEAGSVDRALDAQRGLFKAYGVLSVIAVCLGVVGAIAAFVMTMQSRGLR